MTQAAPSASQRVQVVPLPQPAPFAVTLDHDEITVTNLTVTDQDGALYLGDQAPEDRAHACARALKVGLVALRQAGVTINVDYMQRELERQLTLMSTANDQAMVALDKALRNEFGDGTGRLPLTLEKYLGERGSLRRLVSDLFDEERRDSAIGRMRSLLGDYFDGDAGKLATLLNPNREGSPLHDFRDEVREGFRGIADRLTALEAAKAARAEERTRSTAKGGDFEATVHDALADIARSMGDVLEDTSKTVGDSLRAKKGDLVLHLNPTATNGLHTRVAIEVKSGGVNLPTITRELVGARANRNAAVGLAIYATGCAPSGCAPLTLHGSDVICEFDSESGDATALDCAIRLARSLAMMSARSSASATDVAAIRTRIEAVRNALARVKGMKSSLTSISRCADDVSGQLDELRRDVNDSVAGIEAELASPRPSDGR